MKVYLGVIDASYIAQSNVKYDYIYLKDNSIRTQASMYCVRIRLSAERTLGQRFKIAAVVTYTTRHVQQYAFSAVR